MAVAAAKENAVATKPLLALSGPSFAATLRLIRAARGGEAPWGGRAKKENDGMIVIAMTSIGANEPRITR